MDPINKYVLDHAPVGICDPGIHGIISAQSVDDLLTLYKENIDFSLDQDFPSPVDLQRFGGEALERHGIYIGTDLTHTITDKGFLALLQSCTANITCKGFSVSEIYIKHTSRANIQVTGNAYVNITIFDQAHVEVTNSGSSRVTVRVYGAASVQAHGKVKVIHKHRNTY